MSDGFDFSKWPSVLHELEKARGIAADTTMPAAERRARVQALRRFHEPLMEQTVPVYDTKRTAELTPRHQPRAVVGVERKPSPLHIAVVQELDIILSTINESGASAEEPGYFADFTKDMLARRGDGTYTLRGTLAGYLRVAMDEYPSLVAAMLAGKLYDQASEPMKLRSIEKAMSKIRSADRPMPVTAKTSDTTAKPKLDRWLEQQVKRKT